GAGDEVRIIDRRRVDGDLVGAGEQQPADILDALYPATDGYRHEAVLGRAGHHVENGVAAFVARGDVEEGQFIGAGGVIGDRGFHRIAGIHQVDELHALDHAAAGNIEAGDQTGFEGHGFNSGG